MRYKFYREHKYVSFALNELERLVARTDFTDSSQIEKVIAEWNNLSGMLEGHANYENERLHPLLKKKGSAVYAHVEEDHNHFEEAIGHLEELLEQLQEGSQDQIELGNRFYLAYRKFVGDNLVHLHEEETIILPELQRLYSDEELREVEFATYRVMTPEEMVQMAQALFPQMNPQDRKAILLDIKDSEPKKFLEAWAGISKLLSETEKNESIARSLRK